MTLLTQTTLPRDDQPKRHPEVDRRLRQAAHGLLLYALFFNHGCGNVGNVGVVPKAEQESGAFKGLSTAKLNAAGQLVLYWDPPTALENNSSVLYETYIDRWMQIPTPLAEANALTAVTSEGTVAGLRMGRAAAADSPAVRGTLLGVTKGGRSYVVTEQLSAPQIYGFQVVALDPSGNNDGNTTVLVHDPSQNTLSFDGIDSITKLDGTTLRLGWKEVTDSSQKKRTDIEYFVYIKESEEAVTAITAKGNAVMQTLEASAAGTKVGSFIDLYADQDALLPARSGGKLSGGVRATGFLDLTQTLSEKTTYIMQVVAKGPQGETSNSRRLAVYRPNKLKFSGIKSDGVVVASDLSTIKLSWDAATNSLGDVEYLVYVDGNFTAQTKSLTYTLAKPIPGRTYRLSVRARDDFELENNTAVATVTVPIPTSFAGCSSAVAQSGTTVKILFAYPPGADRLEIYRNGSLVQSTANASDTSLTDSGLSAGMSYTYTCRAVYGASVLLGTQSRTVITPT